MTASKQVKDYVQCVYAKGDWVEIRNICDGRVDKHWYKAENMLEAIPELEAKNQEGWHIYAGANPRADYGLSFDANVPLCRCLFADFDKIDTGGELSESEFITSEIDRKGLPEPTLMLASGHGIHVYWRLTKPLEPETWRGLQVRLIGVLGSDDKIKNPERIMRLPGFRNHKEPVSEAFIITSDYSLTHELDVFNQRLPLAASPVVAAKPAIETGYMAVKARAVLYACKWDTCTEGDRNQSAYRHAAQMIRDFALVEHDAWEIVRDWNERNSPPLDEKELSAAFKSAQAHAQGQEGVKGRPGPDYGRHRATVPAVNPTAAPSSELAGLIDSQISGQYTNISMPWPILTDWGQCLTPGTRTVLVGSIGGSKSFMLLQALTHWIYEGHRVAILELERKRDFHLARLLAQISGNANITKPSWVRENAEEAKRLFIEHQRQIDLTGIAIHTANRQLTTIEAAQWCDDRAAEGCRIIGIDPVTSLSRGQQSWRDDEAFMNRVEKIATESGASMVFVTHAKKGGANMPEMDSLSGAAAWARFADAVLWLEAHDDKEERVKLETGTVALTHNRTLHLLKTRSGEGSGVRLSYQFDVVGGLVLSEHGMVVRKKKKRNGNDD